MTCLLFLADGTKVQVTDLGSTNGTYLDEEELATNRAAEVYVGSRITFGEASGKAVPSLPVVARENQYCLQIIELQCRHVYVPILF